MALCHFREPPAKEPEPGERRHLIVAPNRLARWLGRSKFGLSVVPFVAALGLKVEWLR